MASAQLEDSSGDDDFCRGIFLDVGAIPHKHKHESLEGLTKISKGGEGFSARLFSIGSAHKTVSIG